MSGLETWAKNETESKRRSVKEMKYLRDVCVLMLRDSEERIYQM